MGKKEVKRESPLSSRGGVLLKREKRESNPINQSPGTAHPSELRQVGSLKSMGAESERFAPTEGA